MDSAGILVLLTSAGGTGSCLGERQEFGADLHFASINKFFIEVESHLVPFEEELSRTSTRQEVVGLSNTHDVRSLQFT
jgi:hypothetical protein